MIMNKAKRHLGSVLHSVLVSCLAAAGAVHAGTDVADWNFNDFDPSTQTSLTAVSGTGVFDWTNIGTANTAKVAGPDGDAVAFSNLNAKYFDVTVDLTGLDLPVLYYDAKRTGGPLSGTWSYSIDGGESFVSTGYNAFLNQGSYAPGKIIVDAVPPPAMREQQDVIFRYTFSGTTAGVTAAFDSFAVHAREATDIVALASGAQLRGRAVVGAAAQYNFGLYERAGATAAYTLSGENLTVAGSGSGTLLANDGAVVNTVLNTAGASAGDTVTATLNVTKTSNSQTSSASIDFQMLANRAMSTGTSGNFESVGRIVEGVNFAGPLTISGGELGDDAATRVTLRAGTYYTWLGNSRLKFVVAENAVFDAANETAAVQVSFASGFALGAQSGTFSGFNLYGSGGQQMFKGEGLMGEKLDLSAVSLAVNATVLRNREISDGLIDLGRQMVHTGTGPSLVTVSSGTTPQLAQISGGTQSDSQATRVDLAAAEFIRTVSSESSPTAYGTLTVNTEETSFNGANVISNASVAYEMTYDSAVTGVHTIAENVASALSDGEAAGAGATVDSQVLAGVSKTVVDNRQVYWDQSEVNVRALAGKSFDGRQIYNQLLTYGDDDHYTRLTVNGSVIDSAYDVYYHSAVSGTLNSGATSDYVHVATGTVSVVGEGLDGEVVANPGSYDVNVKYLQQASASFVASGTTLDVGGTITIGNAAASGGFERSDLWVLTNISGDYGFGLDGMAFSIEAGMSFTGSVTFDSAGKLNGRHTARLTIDLSNDLSLYGANWQDKGSYELTLSHVVFGESGQSGNAVVAGGTSLKDAGIGLNFTGNFATEAGLVDSQLLDGNTEIQMAILNADTAGEDAKLASDILSIEGLEGTLFVLQLSYDEDAVRALFGNEKFAQINWFDETQGVWINSVLGNSDGGFGAQKFYSSYDNYLTTVGGSPILSHYGVDVTANKIWAVLDHNSDFGASGPTSAVPEPSTWALIGLACGFALFRLRQTRAS